MSILIKSEEGFYEIPADVLKKYKISKEQFEKGLQKMSPDVEGQMPLVPTCPSYGECKLCMDKKSLWASCL
jgi:hypothetical protein